MIDLLISSILYKYRYILYKYKYYFIPDVVMFMSVILFLNKIKSVIQIK